ncbi:MAG: cold shock domain-containing protein [Bdellovibrionales bacterium]|nr:cold shock domain-containing protein [Bdellovibrionales bacterium]
MANGSVKFFNTDKGFGFIKHSGGNDLFFHTSDTDGTVFQENDQVEFEIGEGKKGPCAKSVRLKR